jgi:hypothetical protein
MLLSVFVVACKPQDNTSNTATKPGGGVVRLREACAQDVQKFCTDKRGREMRQCLKQNLWQVSDGCRAAWQERRDRIRERRAQRKAQGGGAQATQTTGQTQATPPAQNDGDDQE